MVFCGTGGVPFVDVPFGFGLFAVESSAGDGESMTGEDRVGEVVGVGTEGDGEGRWEDR